MAPPKAVSRSLRKTALRLSSLSREAVAEAAEYAVDQAAERGGRFFASRYPLYAEVVEKKDNKKRTTVLVYPKPAGGWAIKSYGRRESIGPLVIPSVGVRPRARAAGGDDRWANIQRDVFDRYPETMGKFVAEALEG